MSNAILLEAKIQRGGWWDLRCSFYAFASFHFWNDTKNGKTSPNNSANCGRRTMWIEGFTELWLNMLESVVKLHHTQFAPNNNATEPTTAEAQ